MTDIARPPISAQRVSLAIVLAALALAAAWLAWHTLSGAPTGLPVPRKSDPTATIEALAKLPARPEDIASQKLEPIGYDKARALNAAIPFAELKPLPARPFRFTGGSIDRARAVDCLAIAAMAEAGGGDPDQRAVIQVILNRVRHPAFAKTVCGVVFQGSERVTGCQFTFTCDGALARRYSDASWAAARRRANEALDGKVFTPVGAATHYHTDWVHPVWSSQLSKIGKIDTHLFFRWPGYWGSRDAQRIGYRGGEPAVAKLAFLESHAAAATEAAIEQPETQLAMPALPGVRPAGSRVGVGQIVVSHPQGGAYLVHFAQRPNPADALSLGRRLCGGRGYCQVLAWSDRAAVPTTYPVPPPARAKLSFSYVLDASNAEYVLYDCKQFTGVERDSCIPPPLK